MFGNTGLMVLKRGALNMLTILQSLGLLNSCCKPDAKGENMKPRTKDRVEGKFHEIKGNVKEKAGEVTNKPGLKHEGQAEKLAGQIQKKVGQVEEVFEK